MNRKLIFQGSAGEALGEEWTVNAPTVADAFRIVHANNPKNYRNYFEQDREAEFTVKLAGESLDAAELLLYNLEGGLIVSSENLLVSNESKIGVGCDNPIIELSIANSDIQSEFILSFPLGDKFFKLDKPAIYFS